MSTGKTTIQNIADALGFSRVTVSKALNNSGNVSKKTKALVLEKAKAMNYKSFNQDTNESVAETPPIVSQGTVALLIHVIPDSFHMASYFMMSLEQAIGKLGYSLSLHLITNEDLAKRKLPASFYPQKTDAILALELFDKAYCEYLCTLGKPVLFYDIYSTFTQGDIPADVLVADNYTASVKLYSSIIKDHAPATIGYCGDPKYCLSFFDRYKGFLHVADLYGYKESFPDYSIITEMTKITNDQWLHTRIKSMSLPKLLVCANDIIAMKVMTCLEQLNLKVPDDIMVCGYDGTPAISSLYPSLTTIIAPSQEMGIMAAEILSHKLKNPSLPNMIITMNSKIYRNRTTGKI
jgi:LacI family transcriptional regulator